VTWPEHASDRTSSVRSMLEKQTFVDVTIACEDEQVEAHRVLLSAASPFFQRVLERNSHAHPLLYIRGAMKKDVAAVLDFIYAGETSVPAQDFESFMSLAKDLEIKGLVDEAEDVRNKVAENFNLPEHVAGDGNENDSKETVVMENNPDNQAHDPPDIKPDVENLNVTLNMQVEDDIESKQVKSTKKKRTSIKKPTNKRNYLAEPSSDVNNSEFVDNDLGSKDEEAIHESPKQVKNETPVESIQDGSMKAKIDALLVTTTDGFFVCNECRYGSKSESHVREHVEMHIEGFAHKCPNCNRTFSKRSSFKFHLNKCQKK